MNEKQDREQDNYNEWSLDFLIDYIINNHHKFSRNKLPEIGAYTKKVASVHGERHPELKQIYYEFTLLHGEMINHLDKEEEILFPYVKQLVEAKQTGAKAGPTRLWPGSGSYCYDGAGARRCRRCHEKDPRAER